jgi:hypothetical protein
MWTLAGVGVLALLLADVLGTVMNPHGGGGVLSRTLQRRIWAAVRGVGVRLPRRLADRWLVLGGPLIAALTPAFWFALLVLGFTLIYLPHIAGFLFMPGEPRGRWTEALYYSGYTATTLGVGDVVADLPALRLLSVAQAFGGFALISVSITYILGVYREAGRASALAAEIALRFAGGRSPADAAPAGAADWLDEAARTLLAVRRAHQQYPILHLFRPRERASALVVQLGHLLAVRRSWQQGAAPPGAAESWRAVAIAAGEYVEWVSAHVPPKRFGWGPHGYDPSDLDQAHRRLVAYLGYEADEVPGARE